ncbi:MAG: hypothetical protein Q9201_007197 [Fulgogasparrea decipioides]
MTDQDEWSVNANEALNISFVQAGQDSPATLSTFHPKFTYPIFGEEECIFGYQGLKVNLRFAAHDLVPNVSVSYDKKFTAVNDTKALDVEGTLREWMPEASFQTSAEFESQIQQGKSARDWKPPGELLESYSSRDRNFEIWSAELIDPAVQQLVDRIQILISLFIEGGTPIPLDDQDWVLGRWRVFFVYEKLASIPSPQTSPYSLVGYSTSYRFITHQSSLIASKPRNPQFFALPPTTPFSLSTLPSRARISQFLILPSHQSHSHGTHLYNCLTRTFLASPNTTEITVEDPNEAFDDLRDYCDFARLSKNGTFAQIRFPPTSSPASLDPKIFQKKKGVRVPTSKLLDLPLLESLRQENKLASRQFYRLVEMYLLSQLPLSVRQSGTSRITRKARSADEADRKWYYWRLLVKQRIYKKNRDVLIQLERLERVEKVEDAVGEQAGDYERLLRRMEEKKRGRESDEQGNGERVDAVAGANGDGGGRSRRERGKRKVLDDEEEELEGTPEPKRPKEGAAAG